MKHLIELLICGTIGAYCVMRCAASNVWVGRNVDGNYFPGFIDDLRITVGSNRGYTGATIQVPTAAFPDA